jgi:hypothetical protein
VRTVLSTIIHPAAQTKKALLLRVLFDDRLQKQSTGASGRNRTGTPAMNEATDFKSVVSTNFTTEAGFYYGIL